MIGRPEYTFFSKEDIFNEQTQEKVLNITDQQRNYLKTMMWYQLTPVKMVIFKKCTDNIYWQGCGEKEILVQCWWKCLYTPTHTNIHIMEYYLNIKITLMTESEEELKSLLLKEKEESEKNWLKTPHSKTKTMASGPITSWQTDGGKLKQWQTLLSEAPKITADSDFSQEIKRCLLLGRKAMTNLDSMLKSRDITFPTKLHIVKAMFFAIVLYRCEGWTTEKAEGWRTDAFELWCWRRLLSPLDTRRSNQSILKEINLEGLMLKLKLQYFGHLMWGDKSLEKPWC